MQAWSRVAKLIPAVLLAAVAGLGVAQAADPIKIGHIAALSGASAQSGEAITRGLTIAIDEINAKGGLLGGRKLELVQRDDESVPPKGITAARELIFREKVAAVEVELKALEMTQLRVVADERKRERGKPNPASSILKIKGSELQQATTELLMDVVGPYVLPYDPHDGGGNEPPIGPDYAAEAAPTYFNWRKISIYGGSNEIQRNIIAKAILGL